MRRPNTQLPCLSRPLLKPTLSVCHRIELKSDTAAAKERRTGSRPLERQTPGFGIGGYESTFVAWVVQATIVVV